jgi:hypothetical protein
LCDPDQPADAGDREPPSGDELASHPCRAVELFANLVDVEQCVNRGGCAVTLLLSGPTMGCDGEQNFVAGPRLEL